MLNLSYIHEDLTMWKLWLTQWQSVMSFGNLGMRKGYKKRNWVPYFDAHRGQILVYNVGSSVLNKEGVCLVLSQKPSKNDPAGSVGSKNYS